MHTSPTLGPRLINTAFRLRRVVANTEPNTVCSYEYFYLMANGKLSLCYVSIFDLMASNIFCINSSIRNQSVRSDTSFIQVTKCSLYS
jgi:hypothetical protein